MNNLYKQLIVGIVYLLILQPCYGQVSPCEQLSTQLYSYFNTEAYDSVLIIYAQNLNKCKDKLMFIKLALLASWAFDEEKRELDLIKDRQTKTPEKPVPQKYLTDSYYKNLSSSFILIYKKFKKTRNFWKSAKTTRKYKHLAYRFKNKKSELNHLREVQQSIRREANLTNKGFPVLFEFNGFATYGVNLVSTGVYGGSSHFQSIPGTKKYRSAPLPGMGNEQGLALGPGIKLNEETYVMLKVIYARRQYVFRFNTEAGNLDALGPTHGLIYKQRIDSRSRGLQLTVHKEWGVYGQLDPYFIFEINRNDVRLASIPMIRYNDLSRKRLLEERIDITTYRKSSFYSYTIGMGYSDYRSNRRNKFLIDYAVKYSFNSSYVKPGNPFQNHTYLISDDMNPVSNSLMLEIRFGIQTKLKR